MSRVSKPDEVQRKSNIRGTIQQQEDAESLVDSIAFGPHSKFKEWDDKLQSLKGQTPGSCERARKLYNDIADGIQGKRGWEADGLRNKAAKALIMSNKLEWIVERCKKPESAALKKKRRSKKTKRKGTKRKGTKRKGTKHHKSKKHVSKYNMMGGKRRKKSKKSRIGKKSKRKQISKKR